MQIVFKTERQNFDLLREILDTLRLFDGKSEPNILRMEIDETTVYVYLDNGKKLVFHHEIFEGSYVFGDYTLEEHTLKEHRYSPEVVEKMAEELRGKTRLVEKLKKKLRGAYTTASLERILAKKKQVEVDARDFQGWSDFDDEGYGRAVHRREGEIQVLDNLIASKQKKRWMSY